MKTQPRIPAVGLAILKIASFLVPGSNRREWAAEWRSEVWYVHQSRLKDRCRDVDTVLFCLGAFRDAFWMKTNVQSDSHRPLLLETPQGCVSFLALLAVASLTAVLYFPGARQAMVSRTVATPKGLVLISHAGTIAGDSASMPIELFTSWKSWPLRRFADFAFYRPIHTTVQTSRFGKHNLSVGLASDNLLQFLHASGSSSALEVARAEHAALAAVSYAAWNKYFGGDPQLIGKDINLDGRKAIVVAILPDSAWRLTSRPDAWLLEDHSTIASLHAGSTGFIIGQIASTVRGEAASGSWQFSLQKHDGFDTFQCVPMVVKVHQPWVIFLFTLFLACASLPATTPLPLGDYPAAKHPLFAAMRWRRWIFFVGKIGFAVLSVFCISTCLSYANTSFSTNSSVYIQFATSFVGLLFSLRWALRDQRRRCPVCLRTLTHPVRVGQASRNFLAWHGTEFICEKGHGLLHIPEMATSWFATQRWQSLDSSWKGLFPETYLPSAGLF